MRQIVGQLEHSIYGHNNLVLLQLLWREAMPKPEKSLYVLPKIAPHLFFRTPVIMLWVSKLLDVVVENKY